MQQFVTRTLEAFGTEHLVKQARQRIIRRGFTVSNDLLNSLAVKVATNELEMWFKDHGRFVDMNAGRPYHKGKYMGPADRAQFLKGRKPTLWYSKLAWGSVFGTLVNLLSNTYIREAPAQMVQQFNKS